MEQLGGGGPNGQQLGIVRTPANLANGSYTGDITLPTHTPLTDTYEMRISYYINGRFHKYYLDAAGKDWIPVP